MDGPPSKSTGAPAPFLLKTYEMVDDSLTDEIVSWSSTRNSFIVWNPPEFARLLLPTYFKHNNFSSFIRQLNTYGFRKIDHERWEFANEDFVKDQKHLLQNIHRRKPIHSHSHSNHQGSAIDPERAAFEEEIDKLTKQKTALENSVSRFKQQQPATKLQLQDLVQRVDSVEQRQNSLLMLLKKAVQEPEFVDLLARKLASMDFNDYNKKRRLPLDNRSPSSFANRLKLELNTVSQSSNEDGGSPQIRFSESCVGEDALMLAPEQLEISDSDFVHKTVPCEISSFNNEEEACQISCQLGLTLASCVSQVNANQSTDRTPQSIDEIGNVTLVSSRDAPVNDQVPTTGQAPVNDVFWEQFLTERPASSDVEVAISDTRTTTSRNLQNLNL